MQLQVKLQKIGEKGIQKQKKKQTQGAAKNIQRLLSKKKNTIDVSMAKEEHEK